MTTPLRHFDIAERRRRLVTRHHLAGTGNSVAHVAEDLVGLHSSDPATVVLSLYGRIAGFAVERFEHEMYDERSLVRMLGMRRTMFVVPLELGGLVDAAATQSLVGRERQRVAVAAERQGIAADGDAWIDEAYGAVLDVLRGNDPMAAREVTPLVPHLQLKLQWGTGSHAAETGAASRILFLLSVEGHTTRARPLGSWLSSQYRWAPFADWFRVGNGPHPWSSIDAAEARRLLVTRWLRTYGPGTLTDIAWWGKWTRAEVRAALAGAGAVPVTLDPAPDAEPVAGYALADDLDDTRVTADGPVVAFVPGLDPALMGWKERDWILGAHGSALFDTSGNSGPMVLVDGGAVGPWTQRAGGLVVWKALEPLDPVTTARIDEIAARLAGWMDGVRVTPRFANPLERSLAGD